MLVAGIREEGKILPREAAGNPLLHAGEEEPGKWLMSALHTPSLT